MLRVLKKIAKDIAHNPVELFVWTLMLIVVACMEITSVYLFLIKTKFSIAGIACFILTSVITIGLCGVVAGINLLNNVFGFSILEND